MNQPNAIRVAAAVCAVSLVLAVLAVRQIHAHRPNASLRQTLYIQSPKTVERMFLGHSGLAADVYWTRAVQYFGRNIGQAESDLQLLWPLLDIATTLDPKLLPAYEFGAFFLAHPKPLGAGDPDRAVELIERGIKHNPEAWKLYYHLGFVNWWDRGDYVAASRAFSQGALIEAAPRDFLMAMAARMIQEAGSTETARIMWSSVYESATDPRVKESAMKRLQALRIDEEVIALERIVDQFRQAKGREPRSLTELAQGGMLRYVPEDPAGKPYVYEQGAVRVQSRDFWPYIARGHPVGWKSVGRRPRESNQK